MNDELATKKPEFVIIDTHAFRPKDVKNVVMQKHFITIVFYDDSTFLVKADDATPAHLKEIVDKL